jgi:predicted secreted protein
MASNAISAYGTLLKMGDGVIPTEAFTTIGEVKSISGPSMSGEVIDVTTHSTGSAWREKISSLLDAGELNFDINFVPSDATHDNTDGLLNKFTTRAKTNYRVVFPDDDSTMFAFAGYVTGFEMSAPIDDVLGASVTITITGAITISTEA